MRIARYTLIALITALAAGCAQERATVVVKASGERAYSRGNYELAAAEFAEAVDRNPADWRSRIELARSLVHLEQFVNAREQLEIVYDLRPNDDEVVTLLALCLLRIGEIDEMTSLLRARAETEGRISDWLRLGRFLAEAGDADNAEAALLNAARLDGGMTAEPQVSLAKFYMGVGDEDEALRRYRMALYANPERADVSEAIRAFGEVPGPTFALVPTERLGN